MGFFICSCGFILHSPSAPCANTVQFFCDPKTEFGKRPACIVLRNVRICDAKPLPAIVAVAVDLLHFASNAYAINPTKIPSITITPKMFSRSSHVESFIAFHPLLLIIGGS